MMINVTFQVYNSISDMNKTDTLQVNIDDINDNIVIAILRAWRIYKDKHQIKIHDVARIDIHAWRSII